jgi:hypothetical protein
MREGDSRRAAPAVIRPSSDLLGAPTVRRDPRPWRSVIEVPDIEWPSWETRFSANGEVRRIDPAEGTPAPEGYPMVANRPSPCGSVSTK